MTALAPSAGLRSPTRPPIRLLPYLYLLPALIVVVGVVHLGIIANGYYSFFDWNGISPTRKFIGLRNYTQMLSDPVFWSSLRNTLVFGIGTIALQMFFGFCLAAVVRTRAVLRGLLRTLAFIPVVLAPAIVATSFRFLLTPEGAFNHLLGWIGIGTQHAWLGDPSTALATVILINVWQYTGYSFLIYDAAMGQIDSSILEASLIDGASTRQILMKVVSPLLNGSHLVLIILGLVSALKTFDLVYLTTAGGPGTSTQVLAGYIYRQVIGQFHAGYGAALSITVVILALIFSTVQVRLMLREAR